MEINRERVLSHQITRMEEIQKTLDSFPGLTSGPVYRSLNKRIAELYLEAGDETSAIFHLTEALGATLRQQACFAFECNMKHMKSHSREKEDREVRGVGLHPDWLKIHGKWHDRSNGVLNRLKDMPSEWTIVQLTSEYNPYSRFPSKADNHQLGIHITRLSCGFLCEKMSDDGEGGCPLSLQVPPLADGVDNPSLLTALQNLAKKMKTRRVLTREEQHRFDKANSLEVEGVVNELQTWLNEWQCLLLGSLIDKDLQRSIKSAVDDMFLHYKPTDSTGEGDVRGNTEACNIRKQVPKGSQSTGSVLPDRTMKILYLLATTPHLTSKQLYAALSKLLLDKALIQLIGRGMLDIQRLHKRELVSARRHPVILLVDEDLDLLPFEMMQVLKGHPVSRMPSLHLLHALHHEHKETTLRHGVNGQSGFFVVNPDQNLPRTEASIKEFLSENFPIWDGFSGTRPSKEEFQTALQNRSVFVYCGHGAGTQYYPEYKIEKIRVNALVMLFGCCSSEVYKLGGRVEGVSVSHSYLVAASPCVVGMLWSVLDGDTNSMTCGLLQSWLGSSGTVQKPETVSVQKAEPELLRAVCQAREKAVYYYNKAALVVRGLPVSAAAVN